jgi:hypothetical protein
MLTRANPDPQPKPPSSTPEQWAGIHLAIVTPTLGEVTVGYCKSMIALTRHLSALNIPYGTCIQAGCTLLAEARSAFVATFLASPGTHLLMIDGDEEFAPDVVTRLLAADRDVIGVAVPAKGVNLERVIAAARSGHADPAVFGQEFGNVRPSSAAEPQGGVVEVESLGTGFVLLKRAVLERLVAAHPELTCRTSLYPQGPICFLFQQVIDNGEIQGEDISFFTRWRRLGGKCHLLVDADIGHTGHVTFAGNFARTLGVKAPASTAKAPPIRRAPLPPSPMRREGPKVGRNDPCPCGSGLKVKKCHGTESEA